MSETISCPFCAERIQADAIICRFCARQIEVPDADTRERLQQVSPENSWARLDTASPSQAVVSVVPAAEHAGSGYDVSMGHAPNQPAQWTKRIYAKVARDIVFNLALTLSVSFVTGFYLALVNPPTGEHAAVHQMLNQYQASLVGAVSSVIGYTISGCWGKEPRSLRARRLLITAVVLLSVDVVMIVVQKLAAPNADATAFPAAVILGSIVGGGFGTAIRCAIGYGLSLLFAKPPQDSNAMPVRAEVY